MILSIKLTQKAVKNMLEIENKFSDYLKSIDLKMTPARLKILEKIHLSKAHISLEELLTWGKENNISRATLFRTLLHLTESGIVSKITYDNGKTYYECMCSKKINHIHLICQKCGNITEINTNFGEEIAKFICDERKHIYKSASFKIYTVCDKCNNTKG